MPNTTPPTHGELDCDALSDFVSRVWDESIVPELIDYIAIPSQSPAFDPDWLANGHMAKAVALIEAWCRAQQIEGLTVEVVQLEGRTPVIYMEVAATPGAGDGEFAGASGIAFDADDNLYVVDIKNHRVQLFTKDGQFISNWGSQGSAQGELETPWGICVDNNGDVYVADWGNNRVQKFSPDGKFLVQFGSADAKAGDLDHPSGVAVDSEGDVYITDWANHRVQVYGPDGKFVTTLVGDAQTPSPWTQTYIDANPDIIKARRRADMEPEWRFRRPVAVNVDANDRIFVLEAARHRLQIYNKVKDYEEHSINL